MPVEKLPSITELYADVITEAKKIKYDMINVNGGFSDGVTVQPGANAGVLSISVDIYGGGTSANHMYKVPKKIAEYQAAYLAARRVGDPASAELSTELQAYYKNLKKAISIEVVNLISQFDSQMKTVIDSAVTNLNKRYAEPVEEPPAKKMV